VVAPIKNNRLCLVQESISTKRTIRYLFRLFTRCLGRIDADPRSSYRSASKLEGFGGFVKVAVDISITNSGRRLVFACGL